MNTAESQTISRNPLAGSFPNPFSSAYAQPATELPRVAVLWLIGLLGGMAGGLLGIGGGMVVAPLLLIATTLRPAQVAGTTLATVLVISAVGSGAYASLGHLNLGLAWPIAMGSVTAAVVGALVARRLSTRLMLFLFLIILPYFAVKEFWPALAAPSIPVSFGALVGLGAATGFFSGLLGIGGSSLLVLSLVAFFLIDHHAAQGVGIGVALADSIAGVGIHAIGRNIQYRVLLNLAVPACVAALAGALLANSISAPVLRNIFGVFVVVVWVMMLARLMKDPVGQRLVSLVNHRVTALKSVASGLYNGGERNWAGLGIAGHRLKIAGLPLKRGSMKSAQGIMNAMLVFIPLAIVGHLYNFGPVFVFTFSALSCLPLSYWLGQSTESLGARFGPVSGGLLNATFGNAAEVILSIVALSNGLFLIVRTTLIGSILGQLLLVLGTSLLLAGFRHKKLVFSQSLVQINFTLMAIALVVLAVPSFLIRGGAEIAQTGLRFLIPALCVLLLIIYGFAVAYSLKEQPEDEDDGSAPRWSSRRGLLVLAGATGGLILISDLLVGSIVPLIKTTGVSQIFIGLILIPIFSNVVDQIVAIKVALKNKMNLSLTISIGSATQIACMVLPIIVLASIAIGQPMGLIFTPVELTFLAVGLLLMVPVLLDGKSNWIEGAQLLTCYFIIAMVTLVM